MQEEGGVLVPQRRAPQDLTPPPEARGPCVHLSALLSCSGLAWDVPPVTESQAPRREKVPAGDANSKDVSGRK